MFKIIALIFALGAFFFRMQNRKSNRHAKDAVRGWAKRMEAGEFESVAADLDLPLRSKPLAGFTVEMLYETLLSLKNTHLHPNIQLLDLKIKGNAGLLALANGKSQVLIPRRYSNELVDRFYSCCIFVKENAEEQTVQFCSVFPEDKEHQFLLEDFADLLYRSGRREMQV